jgi:hypothetical protein
MMSNPAAMIAFSQKGKGGSLKDIMMLQMIQSCGLNLGATPAPAVVAEAAPAAEAAAPAEKAE